jgi:predicted ATPase
LLLLVYTYQVHPRSQATLALAQQLGHTPSLAFATILAAIFAQCLRDTVTAHARAHVLMTATTAQDCVFRVGQGHLLRGWALAMQADAIAGIARIRQGFAATEGRSFRLYQSSFLTLVAEAYDEVGQPEAGLTVLDEAFTLVATTEERWWEAEVWRLKGEGLLRFPRPDIP